MIRRVENYANGGLESVEEWNPVAGTYVRRNGEGVQVETRALAPTEVAALAAQDTADQAAANGRTLEDRLRTLLARNGEFLALAAPTAAERNAQVERLTRQCSALIRLALRDLGGAD